MGKSIQKTQETLLKELERIYGIKHGNNQCKEDSGNSTILTQKDLAKQKTIYLLWFFSTPTLLESSLICNNLQNK